MPPKKRAVPKKAVKKKRAVPKKAVKKVVPKKNPPRKTVPKKTIPKKPVTKNCNIGYIMNPNTNRCIKKGGPTYKKLGLISTPKPPEPIKIIQVKSPEPIKIIKSKSPEPIKIIQGKSIVKQSLPTPIKMIPKIIETPISMKPEEFKALIKTRDAALQSMHTKLHAVGVTGSKNIYIKAAYIWKSQIYVIVNDYSRNAIIKGTSEQHAVMTNVLHYKYGITFEWASNKKFVEDWNKNDISKIQSFIGAQYFEWEGNVLDKFACMVAILNDVVLAMPSPFSSPTTLFRAILLSKNPELKKLYKIGQIVVQSQFWATTASISVANLFLGSTKCCLLQIELPAGYPAMFMEGFGIAEVEFLLAPFTKTGKVAQFTVSAIERKEFYVYKDLHKPDAKCLLESDYNLCMTKQNPGIERKMFKVIHLRPVSV